ncbi:MAG: hypothetical protein MUP97_10450 [Acidimicrobiia bacterium]|nr:hypothetical protein [Acidimicrobiia bacterium]
MSDETPGDVSGGEDAPGWAAPNLGARAPQGSGAPAPGAPAPAAPPAPAPPPAPTDSWALAPAPGVGAPGTKAPRKRRGWIAALVLALGTIAAFGIAGTALFATRTLPPYQGAYDFLDDVTAGREQDAIDRLCAADRDDPEAAFSELGRRIGFGTTLTVNFLSVDRDGDHATVEYQVDPPGTAAAKSYDLPMREEGGDWKACPGASRR